MALPGEILAATLAAHRRRAAFRRAADAAACGAACGLVLAAAVAAAMPVLRLHVGAAIAIATALAGACAAASLLGRPSLLAIAMRLDSRHRTGDLLATAIALPPTADRALAREIMTTADGVAQSVPMAYPSRLGPRGLALLTLVAGASLTLLALLPGADATGPGRSTAGVPTAGGMRVAAVPATGATSARPAPQRTGEPDSAGGTKEPRVANSGGPADTRKSSGDPTDPARPDVPGDRAGAGGNSSTTPRDADPLAAPTPDVAGPGPSRPAGVAGNGPEVAGTQSPAASGRLARRAMPGERGPEQMRRQAELDARLNAGSVPVRYHEVIRAYFGGE